MCETIPAVIEHYSIIKPEDQFFGKINLQIKYLRMEIFFAPQTFMFFYHVFSMKSINVIDIEASGLHFDSYPIEVALLVDGRRKSWLIKPEHKWQHWCGTAEAMHGITRELLEREGVDARVVAIELNEFLTGSTKLLYSDAAFWDADWMNTLYLAANLVREFHIASIFDLLNEAQQTQFKIEKERLAASGKYCHHRAASDVEIINDAFKLAMAASRFD